MTMVAVQPQQPCSLPPQRDNTTEKVMVVVTFFLMIAMNIVSMFGVFGFDQRTISNANPTYVTPDGITFAVWGPIYFLWLVLVIAQCSIADAQVEEILSRRCCITAFNVRWRIVSVFLLNALWLPCFSAQLFAISLIVIVTYLTFLVSLYISLNPGRVYTMCQVFVYSAPICANASWLLVAVSTNFFVLAGLHGLRDDFGVAGSPLAGICVTLICMSVALFLSMVYFDFTWCGVAAWALAGIYRMQTVPNMERFPTDAMNACLAWAAGISSIVCVVAAFIAVLASAATACLPRAGDAGGKSLLREV